MIGAEVYKKWSKKLAALAPSHVVLLLYETI